jgi:hypothetical protein
MEESMKTKLGPVCALAAWAALAAGCGGGEDEEETTTSSTSTTAVSTTTGVTGATGPEQDVAGASADDPDKVADDIEACLKGGDHVVVRNPSSEYEGAAWNLAVDGGQAIVIVFEDSEAATDAEAAVRDEEADGTSLSREPEVIGQAIWAAVEPGSSSLAPSEADYDEVRACVEDES